MTDPYPGAFTDVESGRLMVWWAEPDSPATRGKRGTPGEVLSVSPLVVATTDGALELTKTEWRPAPASELLVGQRSVVFTAKRDEAREDKTTDLRDLGALRG